MCFIPAPWQWPGRGHEGVPGIAFSLNSFHKNLDFVEAAAELPKCPEVFPLMQPHSLLNVNFPENGPYRGIKTTRLGFRVYKEKLVEQKDPMGMPYYWIGGELPVMNPVRAVILRRFMTAMFR